MKKHIYFSLVFFAAGCGNNTMMMNTNCSTFGSVCIYTPPDPAARTACGDVSEFCDPMSKPAPNLSCLTSNMVNRPATPATVTATGWVHVFSNGPDSTNVSITVWDQALLANGAD